MAATATAARLPSAPGGEAATRVRAGIVRPAAFTLLAAFGGSAWGSNLVAPSGAGRAVLMALIAGALAALLSVLAAVEQPLLRHGAGALAVLAAVAFVLESAGVGARLLVPNAWGDLVAGINQGITSLPSTTVPYEGADAWVRTTILAGAGGLIVLAAGLAFWPRAVRPRPAWAALALCVVYGVPAVEIHFAHPWLSGAAFALLLMAFLWAERIERGQGWITTALVAVAVTTGLIVGPRVDGSRPLLDPQHLADPLAAHGDTFTWTHGYGPLTWPRDGREILRVQAQTAAYWKAVNLVEFDGVRWREQAVLDPSARDTEFAPGQPDWYQTITVIVRDLRSFEYVAAGTALNVTGTEKLHVRDSPGTFVTGRTPLTPGDSYRVRVYTPRPTETQLDSAGTHYPDDFTGDELSMSLPESVGGPRVRNPFNGRPSGHYAAEIFFPVYGSTTVQPLLQLPDGSLSRTGARALRASGYAREYALARRLVAQASSPYDLVRRVENEVRRNARYSESPPLTKLPLDTFLFGNRLGYCQQFSGAMALLLRMGGVPARVASGFAPGTYDHARKEYVVRDLDAHSWVEAYFPGYGWIPFDPTPSIAPPSSRAGDNAPSAATGDIRNRGGIGERGRRAAAVRGGGAPFMLPLIGIGALLLALSLVRLERRSRRADAAVDPELVELVRALRRSGRLPPRAMTLARLERVLGGEPGAQEYLRAVRERRYADRGAPPPSRAQRRSLRRVLGAGLGPLGRLRGWWALPPRVLHSTVWPTSTSSSATGRAFWSRAISMLQRSR